MRNSILVALALALSPLVASAQPSNLFIDVGDHLLLPNQPGQTVPIYIFSDHDLPEWERPQGMNFRAQLGDGGPLLGGVDVGPAMTGEIIGQGMLFETNHGSVFDGSVAPLYVDLGTVTAEGSVFLPAGLSLLG